MSTMKEAIEAVRQCADSTILWTWDKRFKSALLVCSPAEARLLEERINDLDTAEWRIFHAGDETSEIDSALLSSLGGVQRGQALCVWHVGEGTVVWAAFWPWTGMTNVSVRVSVFDHDQLPRGISDKDIDLVREVFNIHSD